MTSAPAPARDQPRAPHALAGAVVGVLAAAVAVGAAQLAAGLTAPQGSPVLAVGQAAIDLTPPPVKNFAISAFGTDDKTVLLGGILVVLALYAAVVGVLAVRRLAFGMWGLALFAVIGLAAALTRPGSTPEYAVPTLAGAAAGAIALTRLVRAAGRLGVPSRPAPAPQTPAARQTLTPPDLPAPPEAPDPVRGNAGASGYSFTYLPNPGDQGPSRWPARRRFLVTSGIAAAAAAAGTIGGRELITRRDVGQARAAIRFPRPASPAPRLPAGSDLKIPGLTSFITPDDSFYRVDTALLVPQVDPATWRLRIHGMVQREVTISLADLIRQARPRAGADQLLSTSVDGFTSGTPLQVVLDGRDALLAVAMNGAALPVEHGFPARMVVPGLYGYVSATKWVTDIEITTFAAASAYWAQRGWSQQAPIKTESRIDVPAGGATLRPGVTPVAGVAWAQHKGIAAVEVRVDRGPWHEARLAAVPGIDTWRQWVWQWPATPGSHLLEARATDKAGYTQTSVQAQPEPDGASGYPSAQVTVSSS